MKTCPACNRSYEDDLFFCLEDGTNLSAVYPGGSSQKNAYTAPTEILPEGGISSDAPTIKAAVSAIPLSHQQRGPTNQARPSSNNGIWIVAGGLLAGIMLLLIGLVGYFAWRASSQSSTEPTQAQSSRAPTSSTGATPDPSPTPTTTSIQIQPPEAPTPEATATPNWLEGVWEGEGYQTDTSTTWSVRLTIREHKFAIEYPDIPCRGSWKIVEENSKGGTFTESITNGTTICANKSRILLRKVSDTELALKYSHESSRTIVATATLSKKTAKD